MTFAGPAPDPGQLRERVTLRKKERVDDGLGGSEVTFTDIARITIPWHWRIYLRAAQLVAAMGFPVDARREAELIARHAKLKVVRR